LLAVLQEYEDKASNSSKKGYVNGSKRSWLFKKFINLYSHFFCN
jgi:hypothetical protein